MFKLEFYECDTANLVETITSGVLKINPDPEQLMSDTFYMFEARSCSITCRIQNNSFLNRLLEFRFDDFLIKYGDIKTDYSKYVCKAYKDDNKVFTGFINLEDCESDDETDVIEFILYDIFAIYQDHGDAVFNYSSAVNEPVNELLERYRITDIWDLPIHENFKYGGTIFNQKHPNYFMDEIIYEFASDLSDINMLTVDLTGYEGPTLTIDSVTSSIGFTEINEFEVDFYLLKRYNYTITYDVELGQTQTTSGSRDSWKRVRFHKTIITEEDYVKNDNNISIIDVDSLTQSFQRNYDEYTILTGGAIQFTGNAFYSHLPIQPGEHNAKDLLKIILFVNNLVLYIANNGWITFDNLNDFTDENPLIELSKTNSKRYKRKYFKMPNKDIATILSPILPENQEGSPGKIILDYVTEYHNRIYANTNSRLWKVKVLKEINPQLKQRVKYKDEYWKIKDKKFLTDINKWDITLYQG